MHETPETILNVNDNEPARSATTRILHRAGFKVLEAGTGSEALQIARENPPPLAAGADSFLVEPVEPEELEAVSRALLRLHRSESALRRALAERELLLKEVNHRVKNSLQLVLSMLSLQAHGFKEPETRALSMPDARTSSAHSPARYKRMRRRACRSKSNRCACRRRAGALDRVGQRCGTGAIAVRGRGPRYAAHPNAGAAIERNRRPRA